MPKKEDNTASSFGMGPEAQGAKAGEGRGGDMGHPNRDCRESQQGEAHPYYQPPATGLLRMTPDTSGDKSTGPMAGGGDPHKATGAKEDKYGS